MNEDRMFVVHVLWSKCKKHQGKYLRKKEETFNKKKNKNQGSSRLMSFFFPRRLFVCHFAFEFDSDLF